ncbi:MAG: hypothetical protein WCK46_01340 [Candidatus Adlerbacteria bacterium]
MEEKTIQEKIKERLAELPQDVQDAVLSADMGTHIHSIGQKHGLHIDQIGKLEDETMLVMLGFFDADTFNQQIQDQLAIPAEDAAAIAGEVSDTVFAPIRESLKNFVTNKATPEKVEQNSALPAVQIAPLPAVTALSAPAVASVPAISMPVAEKMLTEKTVVVAPTMPAPALVQNTPAQPTTPRPIYKTDPYREPIE